MSDIDKVHAFLLGEGELDGVSFGERHPTERGAFWWRKHLRAAVLADRAARAETAGVTFKELTLKARIVELEGEIESLHMPTEDMEIAGMEASVLGRPSVDDPAYVLSIYKAMTAAACGGEE